MKFLLEIDMMFPEREIGAGWERLTLLHFTGDFL